VSVLRRSAMALVASAASAFAIYWGIAMLGRGAGGLGIWFLLIFPFLAAPLISGFLGGLAGRTPLTAPASIIGTVTGITAAGILPLGVTGDGIGGILGAFAILSTFVTAGHLTAVAVTPRMRLVA
jgi:hypothetical protein